MRKLIIASSVLLDPHFRIMYDEAESQLLDGHEVTIASCDGACSACVANPHAGRVQCCVCKCLSRWYERRFRGRIKVVHYPRVTRKSRCFEYSSASTLKQIVYQDVNVGYAVCSEYTTLTRDLLENLTEDKRKYVDFLLNEACHYVDVAAKLYDDARPEAVSVFNGRLFETRPFYELAKLRKITARINEVASVSPGPDEMEFRHFVFQNCLPHDVDEFVSKIHKCWRLPNKSEEEKIKIATEFFESRRRGRPSANTDVPGFDGVFTRKQARGRLPENFDSKKHNVVIFNSSEDELSSIDRDFESHALYRVQIDGIRAVARMLKDRSDYHVYLRIHPNLIPIKQPYHLMLYKLSEEFDNLTVIPADSPCSTYDLIDVAEKVVVLGSTAGVEATYRRRPVILIGSALYYRLDVAYKPRTEDELRTLLLTDDLSPKSFADALEYGYYIKQRADLATMGRVIDLRVVRRKVYGKYRWMPTWPNNPILNFALYSPLTGMIRSVINCLARNLLPRH